MPDRGAWTGNRGILHDRSGAPTGRRWAHRHWIVCRLEPLAGHVPHRVDDPGRYTRLFFADEATALAVGHRPCALCRREAFKAFARTWAAAGGISGISAPAMDMCLHAERAGERMPVLWSARPEGLATGTVIVDPADPGRALCRLREGWGRWTPAGYLPCAPPSGPTVEVLTPRATASVLSAGYVPQMMPAVRTGPST